MAADVRSGEWMGRRAHRGALALMVTIALTVAVTVHAQTQQFDIPAQPLATALTTFGQQSGLQVSVPAALLAGKASTAVAGDLSPVQALNQILIGTGLTFRVDGTTVTLEPAPQSSDSAVQLGPVRVQGEGIAAGLPPSISSDPTTTEGTGSYTTRNMTTATRLGLSPRETPQSVSVVTREQLDNEAALSLDDALVHAAGVKVLDGGLGGSRYVIRGFTLDTIQVNGTAVSQPGSDITSGYAGTNGSSFDMAFYDHIEILRGAAGLTQGASNPGGTINLVNKLPTATPHARVQAQAGSWNHYRIEGDVSGPLTGNGRLRGRLVGAFQDNDSFVDYVGGRKYAAYGVLQSDLTSTTLLNVGAQRVRIDGNNSSFGLPRYADGSAIPLPRSTYFGAAWDDAKNDTTTVFAELEQRIGPDWKAKFNATHIRLSGLTKYGGFAGGAAVDPVTNTGPIQWPGYVTDDHQRQTSLSLSLDGEFELFGRRHELAFGADSRRSRSTSTWSEMAFPLVENVNIFEFDPEGVPYTDRLNQYTDRHIHLTNKGIYGVARIALSDRWKLISGARVSWNRYRQQDFISGSSARQASGRLSPYGGVTVDVTPSTTVYMSYSDIYIPQNAIDRNGAFVEPVIGANYEAGIKTGFANDTLIATFAAFRIERVNDAMSDLDGPSPCPFTGGSYCSIASGEQRAQGIEAELAGAFAPNWQGSLSYTLTDTEYRNGPNQGRPINPAQPTHMIKLSTAHRLPGTLSEWSVGGSAYFQSVYDWTSPTLPYYRQAPYALIDLMVQYRINEKFSIGCNLQNLFDTKYYRYLGSERYGNYVGDPRSFTVTLRGGF